MKRKVTVLATEEDLSVDFTLHDFSATLLTEFAEKIVRPYYSGNISNAVKDLIQKAINEEKFILSRVKQEKSRHSHEKTQKKGR